MWPYLTPYACTQHYRHSVADVTPDQLKSTFGTNIFAMFYLTQASVVCGSLSDDQPVISSS
jgi:hypothetical protein